MKKVKLNFIIDSIAFIFFALLTSTGVILHYLLLPGSGRFLTIWGLPRHSWGEIHFIIAIVLLAVLALHLFLHWSWIVGVLKGRSREGSGYRVLIGILALLALIAIALSPIISGVEESPDHRKGMRQHGKKLNN